VNRHVFRVLVGIPRRGQFDPGAIGKQLLEMIQGKDSIDKLELLAASLEIERTSMLERMTRTVNRSRGYLAGSIGNSWNGRAP